MTTREPLEEAERRIRAARESDSTELDLRGLELTALPESLWQLQSLQELYLYNNQLTQIPEALGQLQSLQSLSLAANGLTQIPEALGQLQSLQSLDLYNNQLTQIPEALAQLQSLQSLDLAYNQLTQIPEALAQLQSLQSLYLSGNQLTQIPDALGQLQSLQSLNLSDNQLTQIPEALGQLQSLQSLDLQNNSLTQIPEALRNLTNLKRLYLHENDDLGIPLEVLGPTYMDIILQKGEAANPDDILNYYFRLRRGLQPLNEAKLILVGRGDVGKTSLVNRLVFDTFNRGERRTEGINITQWPITLNGNEDVRLHVWDFGGQEIMHSTHQFFLSQRSLYLLVLNGRQGDEDADADYWLNLIESFGEDSPVVIVLNKIKETPFDLNRRGLMGKYPNIREFIETDCADGTGIEKLREVIERETDGLEGLRAAFPASWFTIKNRLAGMEENYVTFDRYKEICEELGEAEVNAQESLAGYLHTLGIALNYKDDSRLRDTHVLNPHWVTNGIYTILNAEYLAREKGELHVNDLCNILDQSDYPAARHSFVIELMRKFELCFRFPDEQDRFLIPELLDKQQPEEAEEFDPAECLNLEYHYPILPEGLLPRFLVRTNVLNTGRPRWKTGAILQFEGNHALVKADAQDKKVTVAVSGPVAGRRRLLSVIRYDLDHIHKSFSFRPVEMIPIPERPNVFVPYNELLVMEQKGLREFPKVIGEDVITVNVEELLNGVDLEGARRRVRDETRYMETAPRLFYSYSHRDEELRDQLETHLKLLQRQGLIEGWHDRRIMAGDEWGDEIDRNLEAADIILLLVSADFIASDYCYDIEMKRAMERHEAGEARVIPVIVRDVNWHTAPFSKLQALPTDGKAVELWPNRDSAWRNVSEGIEKAAREIGARRGRR